MKTLIIKDLAIASELDGKSMSAVRGGCDTGWKMPSCAPVKAPSCYPTSYEYPVYNTTTTTNISQANNQCQSNPTGNGSAVFGCGGIYAFNNQQGFNVIG
jgi:hypothetical protein